MNRYQNIPQTKYQRKRAYQTTRYPEIPFSENDIYVITTDGDRFDLLAQEYYNDSTLWWVISTANRTLSQNSLLPPPGSQIRIPGDLNTVLQLFNSVNS
jgi:nucleoid-associated protein YgaU